MNSKKIGFIVSRKWKKAALHSDTLYTYIRRDKKSEKCPSLAAMKEKKDGVVAIVIVSRRRRCRSSLRSFSSSSSR